MPSGRTHDSITLWGLPLVAGITFESTRSSSLTLLVTGGYLFSGLMFGPDLDIYSQQYKRWGPLRWIWLPYRRWMRHRSVWSHGPLVGTIVRVGYLFVWLSSFTVVGILVGAIVTQSLQGSQWHTLTQQWLDASTHLLLDTCQRYGLEGIMLSLGLEIGALSHSLSDWIGSAYRRARKRRARKSPPLLPMELTPSEAESIVPFPDQTQPAPQLSRLSQQPGPTAQPQTQRRPELPPFV